MVTSPTEQTSVALAVGNFVQNKWLCSACVNVNIKEKNTALHWV